MNVCVMAYLSNTYYIIVSIGFSTGVKRGLAYE